MHTTEWTIFWAHERIPDLDLSRKMLYGFNYAAYVFSDFAPSACEYLRGAWERFILTLIETAAFNEISSANHILLRSCIYYEPSASCTWPWSVGDTGPKYLLEISPCSHNNQSARHVTRHLLSQLVERDDICVHVIDVIRVGRIFDGGPILRQWRVHCEDRVFCLGLVIDGVETSDLRKKNLF